MTLATAPASSVQNAAARLVAAARDGVPCAPVRHLIGREDVDLAYRVQQAVTAHRRQAGARRIGRKIGLTSAAVQAQVGVAQPDFGILFDDMPVENGASVPAGRLLQPRVEAEVAFVLAEDLLAGPFTVEGVRAAVGSAVAAIEVVDSRIAGWDLAITDTVADNASSGVFVLGAAARPLDGLSTAEVTMAMTVDGLVVSRGSGRECLGDPLAALAWLATTAARLGDPLRAGEVVLSGALGPLVPVSPGAHVRASISSLGEVSVHFAPGGTP